MADWIAIETTKSVWSKCQAKSSSLGHHGEIQRTERIRVAEQALAAEQDPYEPSGSRS
jgi:hypothetical protein